MTRNEFEDIPLLKAEAGRYPWQDIRSLPLRRDLPPPDASKLLLAFSTAMPLWAQWLMRLRDLLVSPLGLKTAEVAMRRAEGPFHIGQQLGVFGILYLGEHAVVLGQDDRHLDFRLVLQWQPGWLRMATLVRPHNLLGRGYLAWVTPWHYLIAGASGRRMAAALQSQ
ncbi:DUF2867 domain-containing protein [Chromobacterium sinusclupearum]|nr:DUF2867 domain-containing protein [Chromobacterium sinusclupearum]